MSAKTKAPGKLRKLTSTLKKSKQGAQQADFAHVNQEMYKQNLELADRNKTLMLLRRIDEVVLRSTAPATDIAQVIADLLVNEGDFNLAIVYITDKGVSHMAAHGLAATAKTPETDTILGNQLHTVMLHHSQKDIFSEVSHSGKTLFVSNFSALKGAIDDEDNQLLKQTIGAKSLSVSPLRAGTRLVGAIVLGLAETKGEVSQYHKNLIERLTATISIAIENHLLYEELQEAGTRLRAQNIKLKELDQTKDEFITMASHQLRTPLTAIKGYLSLVLEGDAGPLTKDEREMIKDAFDGAQRMVGLIADLLNVSRLQTGKFVIENAPTDLSQMVATEVNQLEETAKNHKVKLIYKKPEKFPSFMLDETKVRQVVMNFIDNAIYYTPKEGTIEVALEATDDSVICTVTDNGLGVPKAQQSHLFAKFYRADNARKARPDGTGLGLFMAKKVVVAQGGAIIFKSVEGKGSTFGFSFPRKGIEVKASDLKNVEPKPEDTTTPGTKVTADAPAKA